MPGPAATAEDDDVECGGESMRMRRRRRRAMRQHGSMRWMWIRRTMPSWAVRPCAACWMPFEVVEAVDETELDCAAAAFASRSRTEVDALSSVPR